MLTNFYHGIFIVFTPLEARCFYEGFRANFPIVTAQRSPTAAAAVPSFLYCFIVLYLTFLLTYFVKKNIHCIVRFSLHVNVVGMNGKDDTRNYCSLECLHALLDFLNVSEYDTDRYSMSHSECLYYDVV